MRAAERLADHRRLQRRVSSHRVAVEDDVKRETDRRRREEEQAHADGLKGEAEENPATLIEPVDQGAEPELADDADGRRCAEHPRRDPRRYALIEKIGD